MNWHSQGLIYGAVAMIYFLDTDEGKEIAKKNLGVIGIKGIAITPNMVNDLNSKFTFINLMKKRLNGENKGKKEWKALPLINFSTQVNEDDNVPKIKENKVINKVGIYQWQKK